MTLQEKANGEMQTEKAPQAEGQVEGPRLRIISLGVGVQSSTMALMAAHGEITPMPDAAIFADTGWEPKAVYEYLDWLESGNVLPFPIYRASRGNLRDDLLTKATTGKEAGRFAAVPFFTESGGMGRRQCTKDYKLYPIRDQAKALLGWPAGKRIAKGSIECWIGISTDEAARMKPATVQYMTNRFPLIEKGMSRRDCLRWFEGKDYPAPAKSSCIGCPYHNDRHWRDMKDNAPEEWNDAVLTDRKIRAGGTLRGMRDHQYMHRSLKPLDEVDLSTAEERGQINMFNDECEGLCGV